VALSLKSPEAKIVKAPLESALRPVTLGTGMGVDQLEDVILSSGDTPDHLLMLIRAVKPFDAAAVRKNLRCAEIPERVGAVDLYPITTDGEPVRAAACFPDQRTALVGSRELLEKAVAGGPPVKLPEVVSAVKDAVGTTPHVWMTAPMPMLRYQAAQFASLGVEESVFNPAVDKIGQVALAFDLSSGIRLRVALECGSETEARTVRGAVDSLRQALHTISEKAAEAERAPSTGQTGSAGSGAPGAPGGPSSGSGPGGRAGPSGGGPGGPGGGYPGSGGYGGASSGSSTGYGGGSSQQSSGGDADRSPNTVWKATEIKQNANRVLVTLPPVKVEGERSANPLDLVGALAQASFARNAVGTPLFPGPLRRSADALRGIMVKDGAIPPGTVANEKHPRPISRIGWMASLLPFLGQQEAYDQINFGESWTYEKNIPVALTIVEAFLDPNVPQRRWRGLPFEGVALTHFVGMAGVGPEAPRLPKEHPKAGIFGYDRKTALDDIRDGASHTILMIQVRDVFGPWLQGGGATVRAAQSPPYLGVTGGFGSPGPNGGAMTIFADGSVRFLSKDIDSAVFESLCTINGGEPVDPDQVAPPAKTAAR
jgi:hypothetical protein